MAKQAKAANRPEPARRAPDICLVLMPFGPAFDRYYTNIFVPAVREAGLEAVRGDSLFRPSAIMADIWSLIKESKLLLADLTGKNPNVFYELGLAHGIGKPVVLVANQIEDVPFDLRALRVLLYDKDDENWGHCLKSAIVKAMKETLDDIPSAVPSMFIETQPPTRPTQEALQHELRRVWEAIRRLQPQRRTRSSVAEVRPSLGERLRTTFLPDLDPDSPVLVDIIDAGMRGLRLEAIKHIRSLDPSMGLHTAGRVWIEVNRYLEEVLSEGGTAY